MCDGYLLVESEALNGMDEVNIRKVVDITAEKLHPTF